MKSVYKSTEGERPVRERYLAFLKHWPVPHEQLRLPTSQGETFVVASGAESAPPLVLLHGSAANSVVWMGDVRVFAEHFRVYAVDMIGGPGLSAASQPVFGSDAHALWLDDVLNGASGDVRGVVRRVAGAVLRHPASGTSVANRGALSGRVGRQKVGIELAAMALRMCGA